MRGMGGELPPPNLEKKAVLQGKNGSKMFFSRAIYWAKDHWGTTGNKKKNVTENKISQSNL